MLLRIIRVRLLSGRLQRVVGESDIFQSVMRSFFVRGAAGVDRDGSVPLDELPEQNVAVTGPSPSRIAEVRQLAGLARAPRAARRGPRLAGHRREAGRTA